MIARPITPGKPRFRYNEDPNGHIVLRRHSYRTAVRRGTEGRGEGQEGFENPRRRGPRYLHMGWQLGSTRCTWSGRRKQRQRWGQETVIRPLHKRGLHFKYVAILHNILCLGRISWCGWFKHDFNLAKIGVTCETVHPRSRAVNLIHLNLLRRLY